MLGLRTRQGPQSRSPDKIYSLLSDEEDLDLDEGEISLFTHLINCTRSGTYIICPIDKLSEKFPDTPKWLKNTSTAKKPRMDQSIKYNLNTGRGRNSTEAYEDYEANAKNNMNTGRERNNTEPYEDYEAHFKKPRGNNANNFDSLLNDRWRRTTQTPSCTATSRQPGLTLPKYSNGGTCL